MNRNDPGCISVKTPLPPSIMWVPVPAPVTICGARPALGQRRHQRLHPLQLNAGEAGPLAERHHLLQVAPIGLQAAESQVRIGLDGAGKCDRIVVFDAAGAAEAEVEIDVDVELASGGARHRGIGLDVAGVIGNCADLGAADQQALQSRQLIVGWQPARSTRSR